MNRNARRALTAVLAASSVALGIARAAADPAAGDPAAMAEQRADAASLRRFLVTALHSSNLRLRVMTGRMFDATDGASIGQTYAPIDALAEAARGSTDPMVLALLIDPCGDGRLKPKPTCDAVDLARRWTVADTQNQLAWLTLSAALRARRDAAGSRAAFNRAASASMWHEYFDDGSRTIAAAIPRDFPDRARLETLQLAPSISMMELAPFDAASTFYFHCRDPDLHDACVRILDTLARDSSSLFGMQMALAAAERAGVDARTLQRRTMAFEALLGASLDAPRNAAQITDAAELTAAIQTTERRIEVGELASLRAELARSGMTEPASASRWRQYLNALAEQLNATRETAGPP